MGDLCRVVGAALCAVLLAHSAALPDSVFVPHPCDPALQNPRLVCGTVTVPENRSAAGGRAIALNVAIVRAARKRPDAVPMFHLDGGPGIGATGVAGFYLGPGSFYAATRDVVIVDQRGTGRSGALRCARVESRPPWEDEYRAEDVAECRRTLEAQADLTQYSTESAALDLDSVRQAVGAASIDLWALSYGTRLAQVYLKRFPARVHAAALVGFAPLDYRTPLSHAVNAQRVLDLILYECQHEAACARKYPNLRDEWQSLLRRFDAGPVTLTMRGGEVSLGRGRFAELFRNMLTTGAGQRGVPAIVHAAATGDFAPFAARASGPGPPFAMGLYLSIVCSEAVPRIPEDASPFTAGTFLGAYRVSQERFGCADWPRYAVPADFYDPLRTSVPILVISGTMDSVTTPDWAREFCSSTAACVGVNVPDLGHGPFDLGEWTEGDCVDRVTAAFFDDPRHVDASCVARMKPPPFK
jgi:pimeloyl-ACP methyl ester carboxylesterase